MDQEMVELRLAGIAGQICTVQAERRWNVHTLKKTVEEKTGISRWEQRLFVGLTEYPDRALLSTMPEGSDLDVTLTRRDPTQATWLHNVEADPSQLEQAPEEIQADREVVLTAVKQRGWVLRYAAEALRADREVVMAAVTQPHAYDHMEGTPRTMLGLSSFMVQETLRCAAHSVLANREVVLAAVQRAGVGLQFAAQHLRADREVVLTAVKENGKALEYAAESLRADKEVVLAAIENTGSALPFASDGLRGDLDVVLAAVRRDPYSLHFAANHLRTDREFMLRVAKVNGSVLKFGEERHRSDRLVVLEAVRNSVSALWSAKEFWNDREIILEAVQHDTAVGLLRHGMPLVLSLASPDLQNDRTVVLAAVRVNGHALRYASRRLRADRQVAITAARQAPWALQWATPACRNDRQVLFFSGALRRRQLEPDNADSSEDCGENDVGEILSSIGRQ